MRPAMDTLREIRNGLMLSELEAAIASAAQAVRDTGKKATITIELAIKPTGSGAVRAVTIGDKIKVKVAEPVGDETVFFMADNLDLTRHNPDQGKLDLKSVAEPQADAAALKTVPGAA